MRYIRPALMVCSDVIEHVKDPDELLDYVEFTVRPDRMVFSTPDRLEIPQP
jgi:2-polyprenyl-3-methyl-5-hydroxy-6-metoxy-1,4-benzoquinol methylase